MSDNKVFPHPDMLDDPEAGSTWFLSLATVVVFTACVLALSAMYFDFQEGEVEEKIVNEPVIALQKMRLEQQEGLTEYGTYTVEDPDGKVIDRIRIPIKEAMQLELAGAKARAQAAKSEEAIASR